MWRSATLGRIMILATVTLLTVGCSSTDNPAEPSGDDPSLDLGLMVTNAATVVLGVLPESDGWLAERGVVDDTNPDYDFFFNVETGAIDGIFGDSEESVNSVLGQLSSWFDSYNMAAFAGEGTFSFPHPDYGMLEVVVAIDETPATIDIPTSCRGGLGLDTVDVDLVVTLSVTGLVDDLQVGLQRNGDEETMLMYVRQPETADHPGTTLIYSRVNTATDSAEIRSISVMSSAVFFASTAFVVETAGTDNTGFHYNSSSVGYPVAMPPEAEGNVCINSSGNRSQRFGLLYAVVAYPAGPMVVESHEVLLGADYEDLSDSGAIPVEDQGLTNEEELILYADLPSATFNSPFVD